MSQEQDNGGLHPEFMMRRRLSLQAPVAESEALVEQLQQVPGVAQARLEALQLELHYDASVQQIDALLALLEQAGGRLRNGVLDRLRLSWYRMTDRNTYDSARHVPHCCNKVPRAVDKR